MLVGRNYTESDFLSVALVKVQVQSVYCHVDSNETVSNSNEILAVYSRIKDNLKSEDTYSYIQNSTCDCNNINDIQSL